MDSSEHKIHKHLTGVFGTAVQVITNKTPKSRTQTDN